MTSLNYHHLRYFLAVADCGGIKAASDFLHVSPPTLSAQVRELESRLGTSLFSRDGKRMVLTDMGRLVHRYAGRIFALGDEMVEMVRRKADKQPEGIFLGIADTVPKLITSRLLERTWQIMPDLRVSIREGLPGELFPALASHQLDLVIANDPAPPQFKTLLFSRQTARFGIHFLSAPKLRRAFRPAKGLNGFPLLVPPRESALRRELDQWWAGEKIFPEIRAEFDDSAAMYELASAGLGAAPAVGPIVKDIKKRYDLVKLPLRIGIYESLYVVTAEREFTHEGIRLLANFAREFSDQ